MSDWDENLDCAAASVSQLNFGSNSSSYNGEREIRTYDENLSQKALGSGVLNRKKTGFGRGRGLFLCNEEGHMARDCTNPSQTGNVESTSGRYTRKDSNKCYKCHEEGHMSRDCPNPGQTGNSGSTFGSRFPKKDSNKCYKCHEDGHMARDCSNPVQTSNKESDSGNSFKGWGRDSGTTDSCQKKCFKCKEEGHFAKECPNNENGGGDGEPRKSGCFKCGEEGHLARDCENKAVRVSENGEVKPPPVTYIPVELSADELFNQGVTAGINFDAYNSIAVKVSGSGQIPKKIDTFAESNLRKLLLENIQKAQYKTPTPVQKHTIPIIMEGRDIMACAQTGSGKTAAYLLPILHFILCNNIDCSLENNKIRPTALIISPTRELAIQIFNEARKFANNSIVRVCIVYGGTSVSHQIKSLQNRGCHVLVATPGRLFDFVNKGSITFSSLKYFVLDEADRMIDMGFKPDVDKVVEHPSTPPKGERQTLMFSATFADNIQNLAKNYLSDYVFVVTGIVGSANVDVKQTIIQVEKGEKREALVEFIKDQLASNNSEKILVFVETKRMTDFLAVYLCQNDVNATSIHGDRFQDQREIALGEFKSGVRNVLVATAVASRGLDIKGVGVVLNFDMPKDIDEYVHRIGRTGRVGNPGRAVSYFEVEKDAHLAEDLVKLLRDAGQEAPDWLIQCSATAGISSGSSTFEGNRDFGASDIRRKGVRTEMYPAVAVFGGPIPVTDTAPKEVDYESWD